MKNNQEFLNAMWSQVDDIEFEVIEKERMRLMSKKSLIRELLTCFLVLLLFIGLLLLNIYTDLVSSYLVAILTIGAAYIAEKNSYSELLD